MSSYCIMSQVVLIISILLTVVAELGRVFPSIPLVAEEDSAFLRSNNLANSVLDVVTDKAEFGGKTLTEADVLEVIDRGGKDAFVFGSSPATYWVILCRLVTFLLINLELLESFNNLCCFLNLINYFITYLSFGSLDGQCTSWVEINGIN